MPKEGEEVAATMKDLREVETSLTSLVDKSMDELRDLIAKLASVQASAPSASSALVDNSSENVAKENEEVEEGEGEGKGGESKNKLPKKDSPSKGKGGKEDYHTVPPPSYTPDPLIPHPHINNIGVPPKIDASSSFSQ